MEKLNFVIATLYNGEGEAETATRHCANDWSDFDEMADEAIDEAQSRFEDLSPTTGPVRVVLHKITAPAPEYPRATVTAEIPDAVGDGPTVTAATIE